MEIKWTIKSTCICMGDRMNMGTGSLMYKGTDSLRHRVKCMGTTRGKCMGKDLYRGTGLSMGNSLSMTSKGRYKWLWGNPIRHSMKLFDFFSVLIQLIMLRFRRFLIFFSILPTSIIKFIIVFLIIFGLTLLSVLPLFAQILNAFVAFIASFFIVILCRRLNDHQALFFFFISPTRLP